MATSIPYDDWVVLLGEWYLRNDPGEPFVLYADATVLSEITGLTADAARKALVEAVRAEGGSESSGRRFLEPVAERVRLWQAGQRATGYPPYLPVLVLSVVVASEMRDSNYYTPFRKALKLYPEDAGIPQGFEHTVKRFWLDLLEWLNGEEPGQLDGLLGHLISKPNRAWPNVGHPRAQAVWKLSDARKLLPALTDLRPLATASDAAILSAVRSFAEENRSRLSGRALRTIFDDEYESVVTSSLKHFELGDHQRAKKTRDLRLKRAMGSATARLWVTDNPVTRQKQLRLLAKRPREWPQTLELNDSFGNRVTAECRPEDTDTYRIATQLGSRELSLGIILEGANYQIRFDEASFYLLGRETGPGWRQLDEILPGQPFGIVLPHGESGQIRQWVAGAFSVDGPITQERIGDWQVFLGLSVRDLSGLPDVIAQTLADERTETLELAGGLRASRRPRTFLTGEAPDVRGQGVRRDQEWATAAINGADTQVSATDGRLVLRNVLKEPGRYEIKHGRAAVRLTMADDGDAREIHSWPMPVESDRSRHYHRRTKAEIVLMGGPGELHRIPALADAWLGQLGLSPEFVPIEIHAPFEPLWAVVRGDRCQIRRLRPPPSAPPGQRQVDQLSLAIWRNEVQACNDRRQIASKWVPEWDAYVAMSVGAMP